MFGNKLLVWLQIWSFYTVVFAIVLTIVFPHTCYKKPNLCTITRMIILCSHSCNHSDQILKQLQEWSFYTVDLTIMSCYIKPSLLNSYSCNCSNIWLEQLQEWSS